MTNYLCSKHFPCHSDQQALLLDSNLATLLRQDYHEDFLAMMAGYQRILANNQRRKEWPAINDKLRTLFMCGRAAPLNGPMTGIPVSIRDSDFFQSTSSSHERSIAARIEVLATAWNATFADTGLWMGKTFEPVSRSLLSQSCEGDLETVSAYNEAVTRIGRNFFREPANPFQMLGLPTLTLAWQLKDRPLSVDTPGFPGKLIQANLDKEVNIPTARPADFSWPTWANRCWLKCKASRYTDSITAGLTCTQPFP